MLVSLVMSVAALVAGPDRLISLAEAAIMLTIGGWSPTLALSFSYKMMQYNKLYFGPKWSKMSRIFHQIIYRNICTVVLES